MVPKYLDLAGLQRYDGKIKDYIAAHTQSNVGYVAKALSTSGGGQGAFTNAELAELRKDVAFVYDTTTGKLLVLDSVDASTHSATFVNLEQVKYNGSSQYEIEKWELIVQTDNDDGSYAFTKSAALNITTALAGKKNSFTFNYAGVTSTSLSQGSTTSTIVINLLDVQAIEGMIAKSGTTYFIWNGASWQTLSNVPVDTAITNSEIDALFS